MIRQILAFWLVFGLMGVTQAQQTASTDKKTLQAVVTGFFDALADLDAEKAKLFCTEDITILESGEVWNFDSLAIRLTTRKAKSPDFNRVNKLIFIETKISGDNAWLSYFNQAVITSSARTVTVKWLESVVLKKVGIGWKISLLHSTELERSS